MEFRIDELLDGFEDQSVQIQTVEYTSADRIKELTMNKIKQDHAERNRRRGARKLFTVMLAAVLVFALTAGAFAVFSIHQKRQQQLREDLKIDENKVASYEEYIDPQEAVTEDVVTELPVTVEEKQELDQIPVKLLSAIRDGELQRVYANLSPVSKEEAMKAIANEVIFFSIDGGESVQPVQFLYDTSIHSDGTTEQVHNLMMDYSYDEQTETLMFACNILVEELPETGSITLDILRIEDFYIQDSYGSVSFEPTATEMRQIMFDEPVELHNETLQEDCYVVGVQLYPTGATYMVELNNGERLFSPVTLTEEEQDALMSWIGCIDPLLSGAALVFEDGSEFATGTIMGCPYENGYVMHKAWWEATINIHNVFGIRIADETKEINKN